MTTMPNFVSHTRVIIVDDSYHQRTRLDLESHRSEMPLESGTLQNGAMTSADSAGKSKDEILEQLLASALSRAVEKHCTDDGRPSDTKPSTQATGTDCLFLF